jgi:hypothetical protein
MDDFFCKTRLFWAISRILFAGAVFVDFLSIGQASDLSASETVFNTILLLFSGIFVFIAINEIRKKETNRIFLFFVGLSSLIMAVTIAVFAMGHLKPGYSLVLILFFNWLVVIGLKDILGNHFYIED